MECVWCCRRAVGRALDASPRRGLGAEWIREDEEEAVARTRGWTSTLVAGMSSWLLGSAVARAQDAVAPVTDPLAVTLVEVAPVGTPVEPGEDTLHDAVEEAEPGDTLLLQPGVYELTHTVLIDKDLTIRGVTERREDVHIVGTEEFDFQEDVFTDPLDWGHLLFATSGAAKVSFSYFTIKGAPEVEAIDELTCEGVFGLNHSECFGDAIHADGTAEVEVHHVEASLNAGNGIWVDGATKATFRKILAVNNGAFGIDVDTALELSIRDSTFVANQVSGVEASGHEPGLPRAQYVAKVSIDDTVAKGNGEIGIEVERFRKASIEDVVCADNREDGFDADRVSVVKIRDGAFVNNLDDGMELFPVDVAPEEQPADFPGSIVEDFDEDDLDFSGNVGEDINHASTEN
jgi:hypothetical protein